MGAKPARPGLGSFEAIMLLSQASVLGPETSKREKPVISSKPTPVRTALHSSPTIGNALERLSEGFSLNSFDAKYKGTSRSQLFPHWQPASVIASCAGAIFNGRPAGSCSFG